MKQIYRLVMDPNINPLSALPKMVQFQFMTIVAFMWSFVFSAWVGLLSAFGSMVGIHLVLLIGVFFTSAVFRKAREMRPVCYDMRFEDSRDGCARYDDVWGG